MVVLKLMLKNPGKICTGSIILLIYEMSQKACERYIFQVMAFQKKAQDQF